MAKKDNEKKSPKKENHQHSIKPIEEKKVFFDSSLKKSWWCLEVGGCWVSGGYMTHREYLPSGPDMGRRVPEDDVGMGLGRAGVWLWMMMLVNNSAFRQRA